MATPISGDKYSVTSASGHGIGIGAMPPGTQVSVDLVSPVPLAGMGGTEGVLFSWTSDEGSLRSAHLPLAEFLLIFPKDE